MPNGVEYPPHQDHSVCTRNDNQEKCGHAGTDYSADLLDMIKLRLQRADRKCHEDRRDDHNGRMSECEKESGRDRLLSCLHQLPCHVVDCRDMVGIDRVTKTERISQERRAH